jgi:septal ring factor EnvC (AmiA/AmiB activator)
MPMKMPRICLFAVLFLGAPLASCDKRSELRAKLEAAKAELAQKLAGSTRLQAEVDKLSATLPGGSNATEGRVNQLTQENNSLSSDIQQLKKNIAEAEQQNAAQESEVSSYLTTHSKL